MTVVAIDGPAGSGKSTAARALADRLGVAHVDTGAYYRAVTLAALEAGLELDDGDRLGVLAGRVTISRLRGRTMLDGRDVEDAIRSAEVDAAVSAVAVHPAVRAALLDRQRAAVPPDGGVVEGRDAGTKVVPHADLKVWLTATPRVRAERRAADRQAATRLAPVTPAPETTASETTASETTASGTAASGTTASGTTALDTTVVDRQTSALAERDRRDAANMGRADDVTTIDTSSVSVDEVVDRIVQLLEERT